MKKSCFALMTAALAMTSCTNSEVIDESGYNASSAIGFNTLVSKNSRAIDNTNFSKFFVFGTYKQPTASSLITVFDGTEVIKNEGGAWEYSDTRFWVPGADYTFAAYGIDGNTLPQGCRANLGSNDGILNINSFLSDGDNQNDLVYAKTTTIKGLESGNQVVSFDFGHILSRLNFVFKSGFPAGFDIKVSNIRLHNVRNLGNFNGKELIWENVDRSATNPDINPVFTGETTVKAANGTDEEVAITSGWVYVLPFTYTAKNVDIIFDIDVTHNGEAVLGKSGLKGTWAPKWEKNHGYTYTITINGDAAGLEPIEFAGSVTDWETGTPQVPEFNLSGGEVPAEP